MSNNLDEAVGPAGVPPYELYFLIAFNGLLSWCRGFTGHCTATFCAWPPVVIAF